MSKEQPPPRGDSILAALIDRTTAESLLLLGRVAGTHALLLDAMKAPAPETAGFGRWTVLQLTGGGELGGPMRAEPGALPFCENSFGAVLIRNLAGAGLQPQVLANEASRILAPHGVLLVVECHPLSAWRPWWAARRRGGQFAPLAVAPHRWRRALRRAGLAVGEPVRCGAAWPCTVHTPRWLERICGAAWLLTARKRDEAMIVQRLQPRRSRAVREQAPWMPGARREQPDAMIGHAIGTSFGGTGVARKLDVDA